MATPEERPRPEDHAAPVLARVRRLWPLAVLLLAAVVVFAEGWHRALSLEMLVLHRMAIGDFVAAHGAAAFAAFVALYILVVALSLPGASPLTIAGGALFGGLMGGAATVVGATAGAAIVFAIARSAFGEFLARRAGHRLAGIAAGFREDAFNYLLFLRLVPVFPFWLVNLAPALLDVKFQTFVIATFIGIIPGTFAFALFGAGLDSVLAAQEGSFRECLASGRTDCRIAFDPSAVLTPKLLAALIALGLISLVPVALKRWRMRKARN